MKPKPYILDVLTCALSNHVTLSQVELPERGDEREEIDREVQDLAIDVFSRAMAVSEERGISELIPHIRARLAEICEMDEQYFEKLPGEKEELLVNEGRVYVKLAGGNLLTKIRLAVEKAFIARCHNLAQQKRVIRIVSGLAGPHLCGMGREHGDLVYGLAPVLLQALQLSVQPPLVHDPADLRDAQPTEKSQSQAKLEKLNLDWDDIEWEAEG